MSRAVLGTRSLVVAAFVLVSASLVGCGDDGSATAKSIGSTSPSYPISRAPAAAGTAITGIPTTTAVVGQPYSFQPLVTTTASAAAAPTFNIAHLPAWAKFSTQTGQISGTPAASQIGQYPGIVITAIAGKSSVALPAFTITVAAAGSESTVTLSWQPPTENADGTALVDLKGYKVHYGPASKSYSDTIQLTNAGLTNYVIQNLPSGEYYFAITSYNSKGIESSLSPEVSTTVD
jgi:putative Ig domain-containing protein